MLLPPPPPPPLPASSAFPCPAQVFAHGLEHLAKLVPDESRRRPVAIIVERLMAEERLRRLQAALVIAHAHYERERR